MLNKKIVRNLYDEVMELVGLEKDFLFFVFVDEEEFKRITKNEYLYKFFYDLGKSKKFEEVNPGFIAILNNVILFCLKKANRVLHGLSKNDKYYLIKHSIAHEIGHALTNCDKTDADESTIHSENESKANAYADMFFDSDRIEKLNDIVWKGVYGLLEEEQKRLMTP